MTQDVETIFNKAVEMLTLAERAAYLEGACSDDADLRDRVEALLDAHAEAGGFLVEPALGGSSDDTVVAGALTEAIGETVGPYKLLQLIGEGGFGAVYMAEQKEPVRRKVALKIIKLGMDTKQVIARFEAERQALAMMDHPNIARILDAGATDSGRPYFVMELVKGVPITEYCDTSNLSTHERLDLFLSVCNAVQHAHQKGIIHRDIKPTNVLVTLHDGVPVPKVIDFGIARATNRELTDKTLFTEFRQFIGTPEYMSPEQAEMSGLDIDTRSDIYSLGVLLYELLTGTTPFDGDMLRSAAYGELQRIIREEDPAKPSTRVSTMGHEATDIAKHRKTDASALNRQLRGDLDLIVMKALDKDRTRRYETASALALDIRRHLDSEPVLATPPGRIYRIGKFVRRNKVAVVAAGLIIVAFMSGFAAATTGFVVASRQRDAMEGQVARSTAVSDFLQRMIAPVDQAVARGDEITVRTLLDKASQKLESGDLADQPEIEAALRETLGNTYQSLGLFEAAEPHLKRAVDIRLAVEGADDDETLGSMVALAECYGSLGKRAEAEPLFVKTLEARTEQLGEMHPETLECMYQFAWNKFNQGLWAEGEALHKRAYTLRRQTLGPDHPDTARSANAVGVVYNYQGRHEEAEPLLIEAVEISRRANGEDHPTTLVYSSNLTLACASQGREVEAEVRLGEMPPTPFPVRVSGERHLPTIKMVGDAVQLYVAQGKLDEARAQVSVLLKTTQEACKAAKDNDPDALNTHAWLLLTVEPADLRDPEQALPLAIKANTLTGYQNHDYLDTLALAYHMTGDTAKAIELQRKAIALLPAGHATRHHFEARLAEFEAAAEPE